MIYVGFPRTKEEKKKILIAQTKKFDLEKDIDFEELSGLCPIDYSGADIYAVCSQAFTFALKEYLSIKKNEQEENYFKEEENKTSKENDINNYKRSLFYVSRYHFIQAIEKISPSISRAELDKYEELKKKYS